MTDSDWVLTSKWLGSNFLVIGF